MRVLRNLWNAYHSQCYGSHGALVVEADGNLYPALQLVTEARMLLGPTQPILLWNAGLLTEADVLATFDAGADDFMAGRDRPRELVGRLMAMARRTRYTMPRGGPSLNVGPYDVDCTRRRVTLRGNALVLTPSEYDLAVLFLSRPNTLVTRKTMEEILWGREQYALSRALDALVSRLRKTMEFNEGNGVQLKVVYRRGYRLEVMDPSVTGDAAMDQQ